jgi:hypothetical protein
VDDISILCNILDTNVRDIRRCSYELEPEQIERLKERFGIGCESRGKLVRLRFGNPLDALPYKVHTCRELALMLNGTKPLAYFYGQYPDHPDVEEVPERLFDPYVEARRFVKRNFVVPLCRETKHGTQTVLGIKHVIYALPNQEWRINALILLLDSAAKAGWREGFERMYGSLLGYEAWQNDIFIEKIYKRSRGKESA